MRHAALARMATPERLLPLLDRADGLVRERLVELLSGGQDAPSLLDREQLVARLDDNELLAAIAARGTINSCVWSRWNVSPMKPP